MFSRQRKARVLFGLSDLILATMAFEIAYELRAILHLQNSFYLTVERKALLMGFSLLAWVLIGNWLEIYEKLDSAHPAVILRDTTRQCTYGALGLVVFEYLIRQDLSRFFVAMFGLFAWILLVIFRLTAGRVVGVIRREFAAPHFVMVVGTGERARKMAVALERSSEYGVRLRGFLSELPRRAIGNGAGRYLQGASNGRTAIHPARACGGRDHLRRGQREPGATGRGLSVVR